MGLMLNPSHQKMLAETTDDALLLLSCVEEQIKCIGHSTIDPRSLRDDMLNGMAELRSLIKIIGKRLD
jgi:hypothetical protein